MLVNKIELPVTITFDGKFYLVDHDVYSYDPSESYSEGVYVTYKKQIFKCKKAVQGVEPVDGEHFQLLNKSKDITVNLTTSNAAELTPGSSTPVQVDAYTKSEADSKFLTKDALPDTSKFATKTQVKTLEESIKALQTQVSQLTSPKP